MLKHRIPGIQAEILARTAHYSSPDLSVTTFRLRMPRIVLAEFNTHRMISRNAASSRAIPIHRMIQNIEEDPYIPVFYKNQPGMQGHEECDPETTYHAVANWLALRDENIRTAKKLNGLGAHKQHINRLLEPWMFTEVVATATDWENFYAQRTHLAAEPSIRELARKMWDVHENYAATEYDNSYEYVHTPYSLSTDFEMLPSYKELLTYLDMKIGVGKYVPITEKEYAEEYKAYISVGRCARVSYKTHDTGKIDPMDDIRLAISLKSNTPGHWSPFEHVAKPVHRLIGYIGNLRGFSSMRYSFTTQNIVHFKGYK